MPPFVTFEAAERTYAFLINFSPNNQQRIRTSDRILSFFFSLHTEEEGPSFSSELPRPTPERFPRT